MTHEELAKHWGVSLQEVKSISDFMNAHYYLTVGQHRETKLWHGLMFEITDEEGALPREVARTKKGFESQLDAVRYWNEQIDGIKMPKIRAEKLLNVPQDAYKALNKIPECVRVAQNLRPIKRSNRNHTRT